MSIHFFIFVDFQRNPDDIYPQNSTIFLEKIGCFWHFFVVLFYSVFMQDFGFWLHFYAIFFPFLLFSASCMHVYASARMLTYMRVRVRAQACPSVPELFLFFGQKFFENFCPQWGLTSGTGFLAMREVILASPVILPYGSDICLWQAILLTLFAVVDIISTATHRRWISRP